MDTTNEFELGEVDFQIVSEKELQKIREKKENSCECNCEHHNNCCKHTKNDKDILNTLKETGVYDKLDLKTKKQIEQL